MDIKQIIREKYNFLNKHNDNPNDLRRDWHWSKWKPNRKEIEQQLWLKVVIHSIRIRWHTSYVLDFNSP